MTTATIDNRKPAGKLCAALLLTLTMLALAGCNTAAGFGRDIKNTGTFIEKKADQAVN